MWAKFSPSFANVYMAWWDRQQMHCYDNPFAASLIWYSPYTDNPIIWGSDVMTVLHLARYFNNCKGFKVGFTFHLKQIFFLDLMLMGNSHTNSTGTSCLIRGHPLHTIKSIPLRGEYKGYKKLFYSLNPSERRSEHFNLTQPM